MAVLTEKDIPLVAGLMTSNKEYMSRLWNVYQVAKEDGDNLTEDELGLVLMGGGMMLLLLQKEAKENGQTT